MSTTTINSQVSSSAGLGKWIRNILLAIQIVLAIIFGTVVAVLTFFITARPVSKFGAASVWIMIGLALLAQALFASGAAWWFSSRLDINNRQLVVGLFISISLIFTFILITSILRQPVNAAPSIPQPRADTQYWNLSTGSRLAYSHFAPAASAHSTPIIFLHGGPGSPLRNPDYDFYGQLTQFGFDVYLYDQVGTGLSDRLANVREYTTQRHVADLEAIRQQIGAEQIILIGNSWGATLAADYLAAHPDHVAKVIFSSPGAIWDVGRFKFDYSKTAPSVGPDPDFPPLRILLSVTLMSSNPNAALWLASEQEAGDYFDSLPSNKILNQNYCAGDEAKIPTFEIRGFNQYVNRITMESQKTYPDPRPMLKNVSTPALILRGECDFVPVAVAGEYQQSLPNATFVQVPNAGHAIFSAQPELTLKTIREFLVADSLSLND